MQVGQAGINYYQNNPNFTGFRVRGGEASLDRVMETFQDLSTPDLLKSLQIIKKEANNPVKIDIEDLGYYFGQPVNGHWDVTIGGKTYTNGNPHSLSAYSLVHFLKKLSNKAQKFNPLRMSKGEERILEQKNKLELMELKNSLKNGEDEVTIRDGMLDYIFELIRH